MLIPLRVSTGSTKQSRCVLAYEDFPYVHGLAAQVVMGGLRAEGGLPVKVSENTPANPDLLRSVRIR